MQMMMTKAMREKLKAGQKPNYSQAIVRVRLPEGLLLQGCFNANESVAAIFNWVTDSLADPSITYELVRLCFEYSVPERTLTEDFQLPMHALCI